MAALVVACGLATAVYVGYRRPSPPDDGDSPPALTPESMTIAGIHQSASRDGRTQWSLDAASGQYRLSEKKVLLQDLHVTFFTRQGREVFLTAKHGTVMTDSNDMEAHDEVVARNELYRLETQRLTYRHEARVIESDTAAKITGPAGEISGDALSINLDTNQMVLKGHVLGTLAPGAAGETAAGAGGASRPIHTQADQLEVDLDGNTAEFSGKVRMSDAESTLSADRVVIDYTSAGKGEAMLDSSLSAADISRMTASGQVLVQKTDGTSAEADNAVLDNRLKEITLTGPDAALSGSAFAVRAGRIVLHQTDGSLAAQGLAPGRVRVTLAPSPARR
jgi:lipopolysaccharide export system protein LptA